MIVDVCFICFIWLLHGFHPDVVCVSFGCCNGYTCMLQVYVSNVSSVSDVCCTCVYLDVVYVSVVVYICCNNLFKMFHLF